LEQQLPWSPLWSPIWSRPIPALQASPNHSLYVALDTEPMYSARDVYEEFDNSVIAVCSCASGGNAATRTDRLRRFAGEPYSGAGSCGRGRRVVFGSAGEGEAATQLVSTLSRPP
jgi:hypothetical protein